MRLWMLATTGLLVLSSTGGLAGCGGSKPQEAERVVPELVLDDVHFRVYREARLTARGTAARATYRRDTADVTAEQIQINFDEARRGPVRLTAPTGHGNARTRDFVAQGGVRMVQGDTVATTEEARYTPADGRVHGERPIAIRGPSYHLDGPAFVLDPDTERLEVRGARGAVGERVTR